MKARFADRNGVFNYHEYDFDRYSVCIVHHQKSTLSVIAYGSAELVLRFEKQEFYIRRFLCTLSYLGGGRS